MSDRKTVLVIDPGLNETTITVRTTVKGVLKDLKPLQAPAVVEALLFAHPEIEEIRIDGSGMGGMMVDVIRNSNPAVPVIEVYPAKGGIL